MTTYDSVMVGQIIVALRRFGGESHRRAVIDYIVSQAGPNRQPGSLIPAVIACFERHCSSGDDGDVVFRRRFGETSHRWGLGPGAANIATEAANDPVLPRRPVR